MPITRKLKLAPLVALLLLAACGVGTTTPDFNPADPYQSSALAGTYVVKTADGIALPTMVWRPSGGDSYDQYLLKSDSITLTTSGTFTKTSILAPAGQTQYATVTCTGTYIREIKALFFSESASGPSCGFGYGGVWNGASQITVRFGSEELVAEK